MKGDRLRSESVIRHIYENNTIYTSYITPSGGSLLKKLWVDRYQESYQWFFKESKIYRFWSP